MSCPWVSLFFNPTQKLEGAPCFAHFSEMWVLTIRTTADPLLFDSLAYPIFPPPFTLACTSAICAAIA
jgi:hypothetical protein